MNERYCYKILNINKQATDEELKKAYHKEAKRWHPDLNRGNPDAEKRFIEVAEAYRILTDKRAKKKPWLKNIVIFAKPPKQNKEPKVGTDIHENIEISLFESLKGCKKSLRIERREVCGCVENGVGSSCCPICNGTGEKIKKAVIVFDIPKDIRDGQSIRISGRGNTGEIGAANGNLIIHIKVKDEPNFYRKGNDLYYKQEITFPEAVLGTTVQIPCLSGTEEHRIPPRTCSGTKFRMPKKGIEDKDGNIGDQYVIVKIIIPKAMSQNQIELLNQVQKNLY